MSSTTPSSATPRAARPWPALSARILVMPKELAWFDVTEARADTRVLPFEMRESDKFPFCLIGRARHCNLRFNLSSSLVADTQLALTFTSGQLLMVPIAREHEELVMVNNKVCTERTVLRDGDVLQVGKSKRTMLIKVYGGIDAQVASSASSSELSEVAGGHDSEFAAESAARAVPMHRHANPPSMSGPMTPLRPASPMPEPPKLESFTTTAPHAKKRQRRESTHNEDEGDHENSAQPTQIKKKNVGRPPAKAKMVSASNSHVGTSNVEAKLASHSSRFEKLWAPTTGKRQRKTPPRFS